MVPVRHPQQPGHLAGQVHRPGGTAVTDLFAQGVGEGGALIGQAVLGRLDVILRGTHGVEGPAQGPMLEAEVGGVPADGR